MSSWCQNLLVQAGPAIFAFPSFLNGAPVSWHGEQQDAVVEKVSEAFVGPMFGDFTGWGGQSVVKCTWEKAFLRCR
jgi:hypothetical protein